MCIIIYDYLLLMTCLGLMAVYTNRMYQMIVIIGRWKFNEIMLLLITIQLPFLDHFLVDSWYIFTRHHNFYAVTCILSILVRRIIRTCRTWYITDRDILYCITSCFYSAIRQNVRKETNFLCCHRLHHFFEILLWSPWYLIFAIIDLRCFSSIL